LDAKDMIIIVSIFCDNYYGEDIFEIDNKKVTKLFNSIETINNNMINELNRLEINVSSDWNITQNNCNIVQDWLDNVSYLEISVAYETYEGNFVKNMISLNNTMTSLINYYKFSGDIGKMDSLKQYENIIIRDIVNCESIYLSL
jgi:superfamily II RNA helicase